MTGTSSVATETTKADLLAEADIDRLTSQARPALVPFMITRAQKQRLREMGHDQEAIENMTPEAAHKLLGIGSETNEGAN
jgi:phosphotransferase system IIA component